MLPPDLPPIPDVPDSDEALLLVQGDRCSKQCEITDIDALDVGYQIAPPEKVASIQPHLTSPLSSLDFSSDGERLDGEQAAASSGVPSVTVDLKVEERVSLEFSSMQPNTHAAFDASTNLDASTETEASTEPDVSTDFDARTNTDFANDELDDPPMLEDWVPVTEITLDSLSPQVQQLLQDSRRIVQSTQETEARFPEQGDSANVNQDEEIEHVSSEGTSSTVEPGVLQTPLITPEDGLIDDIRPETEAIPIQSFPLESEDEKSTFEIEGQSVEDTVESEEMRAADSLAQERSTANPEFSVFPVGLNVGGRPFSLATPIVGAEDGRQAIDFENWLIPYNEVLSALRIRVTPLDGGQLELRSPGFVTVLDPDELPNDPRLGLAFSIQDLTDRFDVEAEFDINEYAIQLFPAWLGLREAGGIQPEIPVILDGLPVVTGPDVSITQIEQRFDFSTRGGRESYPGNFAAVGTLLDGSWYLSLDQEDMGDASTWSVDELEYLRQSDPLDVTIGSQAAFWDNSSFADHWGVTVVGRNGFTPSSLLQGGSDVRQRLESNQVGRTISGEAEPGSLVRLVEGFGNRVIAEDFVDSSGIYRFDNIQFSTESLARNYRVLVFADGRLTAAPDIREVTFSSVGGQIPSGTTAWAVSAGWEREAEEGFLDGFQELQGGGTVRFGVNESLTLGGGIVYDDGVRGLAEVFFQPGDIPLQVAVSGLTGDDDGDWDLDANIRFDPTRSFSARFLADELENRLDLDWEFLPGLKAIGVVRSDDPNEAGLQLSLVGRDRFTFARTTIDTDGQVRWNGIQRLGDAELTTRGDDISTFSEFNYNISGDRFFDSGHLAFVNYETRDQRSSDGNLTGMGWRYRSRRRSIDGNAAWEAEVGLGVGSEGVGPFASLQTAVVPGFLLRARYETVSVTSDESAFRLELVSSLNTQQRLRPGDRRTDFLRNQGGLLLEPFFDRNSNGEYDRGEERYTENADLLMVLNNESIRNLRPEVNRQHVLLRVEQGTYRLDLDPAGYPLDWQPDVEAYALEVRPGSYTILELPLVPSYSLAGIVVDENGNVVSGARVEALSENGDRRFSVTNDAGVYFLERLRQDTYSIQVNGEPVLPQLELDESSESFQELDLNITGDSPGSFPDGDTLQI
ncbi:MAG: carboxypeptidase-like regulatory domain-containing protein [Cyanobacteria bacterium P01_F01_bin.150]